MFESVIYFEVVQPKDFVVFLSYLDEAVSGISSNWRTDIRHLHLVGDQELSMIVRQTSAELDESIALVGESLNLAAIQAMQQRCSNLFLLQNYKSTTKIYGAALQVQQMNLHYSQHLIGLGNKMTEIEQN